MNEIIITLPAPLSVNRTRRIDWVNYKHVKEWQRQADALFLTQKRGLKPILGQHEVIITLRDGSRCDQDNVLKLLIDSLRRFGLVTDDSPRYLRQVTVRFGNVEGCAVTVRSWEDL